MKITFYPFVFISITCIPFAKADDDSFASKFKTWLLGPDYQEVIEKPTPVAPVLYKPVQLDAISSDCVDCHSKKNPNFIQLISADASLQIVTNSHQPDHPVGMIYDDFVLNQPDSFRPREQLNPEITFTDGRVTCISCHYQDPGISSAVRVDIASLGAIDLTSENRETLCTSTTPVSINSISAELCLSCHLK